MIKDYLMQQVQKRTCELDDLAKRVDELEKINGTSEDEKELKEAGSELDALKLKKAQLEKELEELNAQISELDAPAKEEEQPQRKSFLKFEERGKIMENEMIYRNAWLKRLQGKTLNEVEQRSIDSSNVDVIPTETYNAIITKAKEIAPLLDEITLLNVAGNLKIGVEATVNDASIHAENSAITPSADTIVTVSLGAYEIVKLCRISATVTTLSINAFEGWLTEQLARKIAEKVDSYIVNGTGTSEPKGFDAETYTDGTNGVAFASATGVTYDEIVKLISLLPARHDRGAKFYLNKKTLWGQVAKIKDDSKYPIFNQVEKSIMGYLVVCDDEIAEGDIFLGNLKNGYYGNLSQDIKVEADKSSGFTYNAIDYRGVALFDGKVVDTTAIVKGSNTL